MNPTPLFAVLHWTTLDVANHLWQSTAVALALLVLMGLCRRLSARTRLTLGWMALAKFALPFALFAGLFSLTGGTPNRWLQSHTITVPASFTAVATEPITPSVVVESHSPTAVPNLPSVAGVPTAAAHPVVPRIDYRLVFLSVWFAGFAALTVPWIVRGRQLRARILQGSSPVSRSMEGRILAAATRAGLSGQPRCLAVEAGYGPGLLGVWSPILIVPRGLEEKLTPAELESVLLHEIFHLRRRDSIWSALQVLVVGLLWFNPVVWFVCRYIRIETEKTCDEQVLAITGEPDIYAGGILKVVRHSLGLPEPLLLSATTPPVVSRVRNILQHGTRRDHRWLRLAALATGVLLLALGGHAGSLAISPSTPVSTAQVPTFAVTESATSIPEVKPGSSPSVVATPSQQPQVLPPPAGVTPAYWRVLVTPKPDGNFQMEGRDFTLTQLVAELGVRSLNAGAPRNALSVRFIDDSISSHRQIDAVVSQMRMSNWIQSVSDLLANTDSGFFYLAPREAAAKPIPLQVLGFIPNSVPVKMQSPVAGPPPSPGTKNIGKIPRAPFQRDLVQICDPAKLDKAPLPTFQKAPAYPDSLRRTGGAGDVVIEVVVDHTGAVQNEYVVSSTRTEFESPALAAVREWTFKPGIKSGMGMLAAEAVMTSMKVTIHFDPPTSAAQPAPVF